MIYALDSNIISYLLEDDKKINIQVDLTTKNGDTLIIPPIVDYEIRRGLLAANYLKKLRKYELLQDKAYLIYMFGEKRLKFMLR